MKTESLQFKIFTMISLVTITLNVLMCKASKKPFYTKFDFIK